MNNSFCAFWNGHDAFDFVFPLEEKGSISQGINRLHQDIDLIQTLIILNKSYNIVLLVMIEFIDYFSLVELCTQPIHIVNIISTSDLVIFKIMKIRFCFFGIDTKGLLIFDY